MSWKTVSRRFGSIAGLLVLWYVMVHSGVMGLSDLPGPADVVLSAEAYLSNQFLTDLGVSFYRVMTGFVVAAVLAIPTGLLIGWRQDIHDLLFPALEILRPIPPIAWVPLALLVMPSDPVSIIFITFLGAFFPILINTIDGVAGIDRLYYRAARSLGAGERDVLRHVVLPGTLPSIISGLIVGVGLAWVNLVAAEMMAGGWGLGYRTWEAYIQGLYPRIILGMIGIGAAGYLSSMVISAIGDRVLPWQQVEET